ncbi:TlpA disulfide reductase family protein [Acetobacteroides hydrogenigenes]|uniref:Peroxiredoxin n=1 Tax=Acetobacteroides hydrogenigenes TaxID=979970 RepID=A0A4R2F1H0_9BACT|nr:TlpA disulfide reductase family protein [Acetobacteroides hydrogenigenes]TCN73185.1 peroxiredoxin [Acetobacteroides hydrogenigenes]
MRKLVFLIAAVIALTSCSRNSAKIKGEFTNFGSKTVYLEKLGVGTSEVIDSAVATKDGTFKFKIKFDKDQEPTFYLVKVDGNNFVTLFLERGETVRLSGDATRLERSYTVNGSKTSEDIRTISNLLNSTISSLDSLNQLHASPADSIEYKMGKVFVNCKREFIKFIITNPKSMASLFAIYSQLPGSTNVFGSLDDLNYFKLLSDSLAVSYPKSAYVISLKKHYKQMENDVLLGDIISSKKVETVGIPEISLRNQYGKLIKLSSLKGKVVLLDFWDPANQESLEGNLGLVKVYDKYKSKGFEVYQVSLATKAPWIAAVQRQKLQWICVSDFLGSNSPAATVYNVKSIPANFLISKNGDLIGRDLFGNDLESQILKALK